MTSSEAKAKLEAWVVLLKAKLEGVTPGKWEITGEGIYLSDMIAIRATQNDRNSPRVGVAWCRYEIYDGNTVSHVDKKESRQAMPAMLAGIEAIIKELAIVEQIGGPSFENGYKIGIEIATERLIAAYEPYFQEVSND